MKLIWLLDSSAYHLIGLNVVDQKEPGLVEKHAERNQENAGDRALGIEREQAFNGYEKGSGERFFLGLF